MRLWESSVSSSIGSRALFSAAAAFFAVSLVGFLATAVLRALTGVLEAAGAAFLLLLDTPPGTFLTGVLSAEEDCVLVLSLAEDFVLVVVSCDTSLISFWDILARQRVDTISSGNWHSDLEFLKC